MPLTPPKLDTRDYTALVKEARARIPRYTPEWTNFNESDPGMTLVQLNAWLAETLLYELNRVPDLNYIKFLNLIGIEPRPALPARVQLAVTLDTLDKTGDPLAINVPIRTKVAVDDPELAREVVFETDETLRAVNAVVAAVIGHDRSTDQPRLVTRYTDALEWEPSFTPLGGAGDDDWMYVALLVRPNVKPPLSAYAEDRLPPGPLDLYAEAVGIGDSRPDGSALDGPLNTRCPDASTQATPASPIRWQVHTGDAPTPGLFTAGPGSDAWSDVSLSRDDTLALTRSGRIVLEIPADATAIDPGRMDAEFWETFGRKKPPRTAAELAASLRDLDLDMIEALADKWEAMGVTEADDLDALAACGTQAEAVADKIDPNLPGAIAVDPSALNLSEWAQIEPAFEAEFPVFEDRFRPLYWLRARLRPHADPVADFKALRLNTISAIHAETRLEDVLGRSDGRPAQRFKLPKTPVLIDPQTGAPDLDLEIREDGEPAVWTRVDDFFKSRREDRHFRLDPETGEIELGDGRRGRVPVAGSQIIAMRYRVGGGAIGNAGAGLVSKLKGRIRGVKSMSNPAPASDGRDAERQDDTRRRAPSSLRTRDRAVSAQDFSDLALEASVNLHSAHALPRTAVTATGHLEERDGAVTVVILPWAQGPRPQPGEDQLRAVCRHLEPRRLVTTELYVRGPDYVRIASLTGRLDVRQGFDLGAVKSAVYDALTRFLDPLRGGEDAGGWPMGSDIYWADLYEVMLSVTGVQRASRLDVRLEDGLSGDAADITPIPAGHLPELTRAVIDLEAGYAR